MKQSRIVALLILGSAASSAACGLSADGTASGTLGDADGDGTTREPDTGAGSGDGAAASDATTDDGSASADGAGDEGDEAARDDATDVADVLAARDGAGEGGDASAGTGDDASDASDAPPSSDAAFGTDGADAADTGFPDAGPGDAATGAGDTGAPSDASADRQETSVADSGGSVDATADGGSCDFNGTWASRLTIDVTWQPQGLNGIILASGSGQIKQWIKGVRVQTGMSTSDATVVCGVDLPDFTETAIAGGETYGVRFPDSLFDGDGGSSGYLPTFTVSAALSGLTPGATYSTTTTAALLGLSMTHPTTDAWPATITTQVDMDNDGKPGVTIDTAQGTGYSDIPTGIPGLFQPPARANRLYVAIRQVTIVTGTVTDCDHMAGTVSIPEINSKYAIDSHVMGCALVDGGDCSTTVPIVTETSQAAFVDNTQPVFTPSGTTDFHSVRLPTGATCGDVRAALP